MPSVRLFSFSLHLFSLSYIYVKLLLTNWEMVLTEEPPGKDNNEMSLVEEHLITV